MLQTLHNLTPLMHLDPYLMPLLPTLTAAIHSRALQQYAQPFASLLLPQMAEAFAVDVKTLERDLALQIQQGKIAARIDSHNKVRVPLALPSRAAVECTQSTQILLISFRVIALKVFRFIYEQIRFICAARVSVDQETSIVMTDIVGYFCRLCTSGRATSAARQLPALWQLPMPTSPTRCLLLQLTYSATFAYSAMVYNVIQ